MYVLEFLEEWAWGIKLDPYHLGTTYGDGKLQKIKNYIKLLYFSFDIFFICYLIYCFFFKFALLIFAWPFLCYFISLLDDSRVSSPLPPCSDSRKLFREVL